jgi:hypothetical protein
MEENPKGTIFEPGTCNMCGEEKEKDVPHCQILCKKCLDDPNVLTGDNMTEELDKDIELSRLLTKPSPYI